MSKLTDLGVATSSAVVPGMAAVTDRGCQSRTHNQVATSTTWSASMAGLADTMGSGREGARRRRPLPSPRSPG
jgi:adenylosuccinate lyase